MSKHTAEGIEKRIGAGPEPPDNFQKKRSFFLTSLPFFILAHSSHHLITALPQPMLPYMQYEFGLNYTKTGFIISAFTLSSALSQLPAGWLADRIGPTLLITMGTLGVAIGGFFVGSSQSYSMLIAALIFMGLMAGGYHPASTPLISMSVPPNQRGRALGVHLIGGNFSFFISPIIAGFIAGAWGWRSVYLTLSGPTVLLGIFFFIYLSRKYGKAHIEEMKRRQVAESAPQPGYRRRLIAYMAMMVLGGGAGATVRSFLAPYMVDVLGVTREAATMNMSIMFFFGLFGTSVGGFICDRFGSTRVIIITSILAGLIIFPLKEVQYGWGWWTVLLTLGLIEAIRFPVAEVFIMSQAPARHRSTIYGVYYSTMQYTGAIFAPFMGGFIEKYGFYNMFTFSAYAVTAVAVITSIFIWDAKG